MHIPETTLSHGIDVYAGVHRAGSPFCLACEADGVESGEIRQVIVLESTTGSTAGTMYHLTRDDILALYRAVFVPDWLAEATRAEPL